MLRNIIYRLSQFYRAMFSRYTKADNNFARSYLNIQEMSLFNQLPGFEKKHSVIVAKKMLQKAHDDPKLDERTLVKLGLLHDIGKVVEHNSIITKSILVIIRYFFPKMYNKMAGKGKSDPRFRRYYIHKHHGVVGAELLAKIGESEAILSVISRHDYDPQPDDPIELKLLQQADSTY